MKAYRPLDIATPAPTDTTQTQLPDIQDLYGNAAAKDSLGSGTPGPVPFLSEMEAAFGTDFSGVVAVFGASLDGIDANAAADGDRIAFAETAPDRETVAHELTHVVQARGTSHGGDGISDPGDDAEGEARRAGRAVARGEGAGEIRASASGVHRQELPNRSYANQDPPRKSYLRGDLPTWRGGTELTEEEYKQYLTRSLGAISGAVTLTSKLIGFALTGSDDDITARMTKTAEAEIDGEISSRESEIAWLESEVDYLEDLDVLPENHHLPDKRARLEKAEAELEVVEDGKDTTLEKVTATAKTVASSVASYGGSVSKIGSAFSGGLGGIAPSQFEGIDDALGKLEKFTAAANAAAVYADRRGLDAFKANPNFETAKAWGADVGRMFAAVSPLVGGLPPGWGTVISGALEVPAKVISGVTGLIEKHQQELDAALRGYTCRKSEMLKEGTTSEC